MIRSERARHMAMGAAVVLVLVVGFVLLTPLGAPMPADFNGASLEMMRLQTYDFALSGITGVATLITAVAAARFASQAAQQSRRSADLAREAMISSERAWIHVDVQLEGPVVYKDDGSVRAPVRVTIGNIGNSPAINVHSNVRLIEDTAKAPERLKRFAARARTTDEKRSRMLLPHDSYERHYQPEISAEDLAAAEGYPRYRPAIIGCITYQLAQDMSLHQTVFSYALSRIDKRGRGGHRLTAGREVPLEQARLDWAAGGFAD